MNLGEGHPAERMLRSVDEGFWSPDRYDYNTGVPSVADTPEIVDAWGNVVAYIDTDGTNDALTSGANQQPIRPAKYFGSAGPDGVWGEFTDGDANKPVAGSGAEDNLYSFEIGD